MTALLGNTESRSVYKNFQLENLDKNALDYSHYMYQLYLQHNKFLAPGEKKYFAHTMQNKLPNPIATDADKGSFNIFPLDLASEEIQKSSTNLGKIFSSIKKIFFESSFFSGVVSTSPLKLELEFSPIPEITWFLALTFVYLNKINFTGNKTNQTVTYDYL